jgi:predicted HAD superfamily Cof-like phosphohydrolase
MEYNNTMSKDWVKDINEMHAKYGVHKWMQAELQSDNEWSRLQKFLDFRLKFLQEELDETRAAAVVDKNPPEIVDGLIDLCVVAIGTLDAFGVDAYEAWDRVHNANMAKEVGVKESRPNPLGLPDLVKPKGWKAPEHYDNTGNLSDAV